MNNSRRRFMKQGAATLAGLALVNPSLFALKKAEILGLQLYSIRDDMKTAPLDSLKKLAKMGYVNVEHAGYSDRKFYGYPVKEFKSILDDLGMKMPSGHSVLGKNHWDSGSKDFTSSWKYTLEDAAEVGMQYVISPWLDQSLRQDEDRLKRFMEVFNQCGEHCKKMGMKFGYHNHDFEFSEKLNGSTIYDIILQNTDPEGVIQQLDIGNMVIGGANAADLLKKYPGRFESLHVKDMIKSDDGHGGFESTILGDGLIKIKEIIDMARTSGGTVHFIIEQESYQGVAPLDCMKEDLERMNKWGY
ncbi:MAG: sugar phosphate isomerase/epimerase [Cyclobacteriaceae bacterium]|nr:sugar phosphate isomerase/epimerase [Cyclobacteriaceae bacterium]